MASLRAENAAAGSVAVPVDGPELAVALRQVSAAASTGPGSPLGVFPLYVRNTPDGMLARFQALLGVVQSVALLVATGAYGVLAGGTPTPALLAAAALTALATWCVVSSAPLRTTRLRPDGGPGS